jgi:CheY-like chemotaxis protein
VVPAARPGVGKADQESVMSKSSEPPPGDKAKRAAPRSADQTWKTDAHEDVILVVDDDAAVRTTVVMQLKALGYVVREADGAQAALQIIDGPERIDLLLTDVVMPGGMNGKELAAEARRRRPGLPVLFTSGFPGTSQDGGVTFDADDVLLGKPYRKHALARAVRRTLATRR